MNSNNSGPVPSPDRNPWVVWSTNAGVAGICGGVFSLSAITISQLVAGVDTPAAFWGSEAGQAVIVLLVLFLIALGCAVLVRKKYSELGNSTEWRFGIIISILVSSVSVYTVAYVILDEFFNVIISDHVFIVAMLFAVMFSIIAIPGVSARILSRSTSSQ